MENLVEHGNRVWKYTIVGMVGVQGKCQVEECIEPSAGPWLGLSVAVMPFSQAFTVEYLQGRSD